MDILSLCEIVHILCRGLRKDTVVLSLVLVEVLSVVVSLPVAVAVLEDFEAAGLEP